MKFLVLLISLITGISGISLENYTDSMLTAGWGSYLKVLTFFSTVVGGILYYVPISRSYFRRGCHVLIDLVALSLKSVLNSFESETGTEEARVTFSEPKRREHSRNSREDKRRRKESRAKNRSRDVKERRQELSTVQLYPGRGLELQKYLRSHSRSGESDVYMLKEARDLNPDVKWSRSTVRRLSEDDATVTNEKPEVITTKKRKRQRKNEDLQKLEEKLRKLRRRIRSIAGVPDKNFREQKEGEALKIIDELLRRSNYKIEIKPLRKAATKDRPDEDKRVIDVTSEETLRSEQKSSRPDSPRKVTDVPRVGTEGYAVQCAQPPLLNDRVTPMMRNALHWIFGGCSTSH